MKKFEKGVDNGYFPCYSIPVLRRAPRRAAERRPLMQKKQQTGKETVTITVTTTVKITVTKTEAQKESACSCCPNCKR